MPTTHKYDPDSKVSPLVLKGGAKGSFKTDPSQVFDHTKFAKNKDDFHWVYSDEPHATRRKEILAAHPEIKRLFGPEPLTIPLVVLISASQLFWAWYLLDKPIWLFLAVMYAWGGTANHSLQLANHEISHNLAFESLLPNMLLGIIANFATGFPSSVTFRMYHMDHHQYQGVDVIDTDIPCNWELQTFTTTFLKFLWMMGQSAAYALRPVFTNPKPLDKYQIFNAICVIAFDCGVLYFVGVKALLYLMGASLCGLGLHPVAGHFIAEHYEFIKGYETYSYYGIINYVNFNVGYHNEHHDFPKVPWSRLPMVRKIAPEWYDHLPHHSSYVKVIWQYITDPEIGPWSRVKRASAARQRKKKQ